MRARCRRCKEWDDEDVLFTHNGYLYCEGCLDDTLWEEDYYLNGGNY
jgi:late competence protein required for DNA uptake (superfamily II DNA/RNA helicase)